MTSAIFWDVTPCGPLKVNRRFRGTYDLNLHGRRISRARYQLENRLCLPSAFKLKIMAMFLRNVGSKGLHGIISQKVVLFKIEYVPNTRVERYRCTKLLSFIIVNNEYIYIVTCMSDYIRGLDW
jgi:hypothetical protein